MTFNLRLLGYNIRNIAAKENVNTEIIANASNLSINDVKKVFEGRLVLTPKQLGAIANALGCSIKHLFIIPKGFVSYGECMGEFKNPENEEIILNIIDDYIDLKESL